MNSTYPFINTPLPYELNSLEPYIDTKTMEIHYNRLLQGYIDRLNAIIEKNPMLQGLTLKQMIDNWYRLPADIGIAVRNNAGGIFNHRFFFNCLGVPHQYNENNFILKEINRQFGSMDNFKNQLKATAMSVFGSGYAWLVINNGTLQILKTANQNTPDLNMLIPVLNIDVWEHAYFLKHYNLRSNYLDDLFNVIDWDRINMCLTLKNK